MIQTAQRLTDSVLSNPHRSSAVGVLFIAGCIGIIWPELNDKMQKISHLAIMYGLLSPGNPLPQNSRFTVEPPSVPPTPNTPDTVGGRPN